MQDRQELVGYQDTTGRMDSLVPRAQRAKKEQMEKEEKLVFWQLFRYFPCCSFLFLHFEWANVCAVARKCYIFAGKAGSTLAWKLLCFGGQGHSFWY